ncbi:MAG: ATP-binding protein [Actinobacteria bacterium]|nr:ATP-binding protein [Actinomycetota bacterium]
MHLGQRVPRGEVAEFVVIDVGGFGIVGRIREVWVSANERKRVADGIDPATPIAPLGAVQLLATLRLDGTHIRGIEKYPRLGDPVYSAPPDVLEALISEAAEDGGPRLSIGTLANDDQVSVEIDPSRLFGRHLAVLGATGSGKSWTVAHLAEGIQGIGGNLIIVDATGEFHTLGGSTTHVSVSSTELSLPHTDMDEADLTAFLRPSAGSQLPKLREAIRSLRLAELIGADHPLVDERGLIHKADKRRSDFYDLQTEHADAVERAGSKFNLRLLGEQIECECIWAHDRYNDALFGGPELNGLGYCVSLITRIQDLIQTPEIIEIVSPFTERASVIGAIDSFLADAEKNVLCISLKDLPFVHYMREITVNAIGRHLLSLARSGKFRPNPLVVAVDEAQQFFGRVIGDEIITTRLEHFEAIAKEGRKYGLTVCMATQRPGDLPSGVLSQAGMLLVHRLGHGRDRKYIEEASSELDRSATQLLPGLTPGEAVLVGVDFPVPISVRIAAPLRKPESEGPNYRAGWQASPTQD